MRTMVQGVGVHLLVEHGACEMVRISKVQAGAMLQQGKRVVRHAHIDVVLDNVA